MLSEKISKIISDQLNAEFYSAYLYLAMSAYADHIGYKGFSSWLYIQTQEELAHAIHIYEYLLSRGAEPEFPKIEAPKPKYENVQQLFETVLSHEQWVTKQINQIASLALQESDHATYGFIQWYVNEQIEEESTADHILQKIRLIGDNKALLFSLDTELGARIFHDPFASATTDNT